MTNEINGGRFSPSALQHSQDALPGRLRPARGDIPRGRTPADAAFNAPFVKDTSTQLLRSLYGLKSGFRSVRIRGAKGGYMAHPSLIVLTFVIALSCLLPRVRH